MPFDRTDLNLFRVFDAVMRHRSLAAAGREIGISASAVSHALTRARAQLGDDLFVAGMQGMAPTARAAEIAPDVATALAAFDKVLAGKPFVASTAKRLFRIGASDHSGMVLFPKLVAQVMEQAPGMRLRILPIGRIDLIEQLDEGRIDLVIAWFSEMPHRIRRRSLFTEREALVVRCGHPLAGTRPDLAALLSFPHLVVELTGDDGPDPNGFRDERGLQRRVWIERLLLENTVRNRLDQLTAVTIPNFDLAPPLLRSTDLIATLPFRLALKATQREDLAIIDIPYEPLEVRVEVAWHERGDRDQALQWLIEHAERVGATVEPLPPRRLSPTSGGRA